MRIVALVSELMDRSRISGAIPGVAFVAAVDGVVDADVVIIDLARFADAVAAVRTAAPAARVVAYGAHVDGALLERARQDGADLVLPRSQFFRDPAAHVAPAP
ncbi:MAG: DNA-binding response regulator [Acidimicrobiia bacterium]